MQCRPSELYDLTDPIEAFCFDRAVITFGNALKAELEAVSEKTEASSKKKRQRILAKWIPEASAGFKDPASARV